MLRKIYINHIKNNFIYFLTNYRLTNKTFFQLDIYKKKLRNINKDDLRLILMLFREKKLLILACAYD